jgi:hypothetical protein
MLHVSYRAFVFQCFMLTRANVTLVQMSLGAGQTPLRASHNASEGSEDFHSAISLTQARGRLHEGLTGWDRGSTTSRHVSSSELPLGMFHSASGCPIHGSLQIGSYDCCSSELVLRSNTCSHSGCRSLEGSSIFPGGCPQQAPPFPSNFGRGIMEGSRSPILTKKASGWR